MAVVVVKEKRKKPLYLVSTNLHLSAFDIIKYYAKRWKIEQMIKDLKQRLGFGTLSSSKSPSHPAPCGLSPSELLRLNLFENPPVVKG